MAHAMVFVSELPELIEPECYSKNVKGGLVRLRIRITEQGIEILGDAMRPDTLDHIIDRLGITEVERILCG